MNVSLRTIAAALLGGACLMLLAAGCSGSNRLRHYRFDSETVAAIAAVPPRPLVFTSTEDAWVDLHRPIRSALRVGTAIVKEVEREKAQARLDSAFQRIAFAERMAAGILKRGADYLGYEPVGDPRMADFLVDLRVESYGILADSWENATFFIVKGDLVLIDNRTREIIWRKKVRERELITGEFFTGVTAGNVLTARMLAALSTDEMVEGLEMLADQTAEKLSRRLMRDYAGAR